jgi:CRP-like cAMP-binding protein
MLRFSHQEDPSRRALLEAPLRALRAWAMISDADAARLASERCPLHWAPADGLISWSDGDPGPKLVVRGWTCERRTLPDGRRQIYSFLLPGDICFPHPPRGSTRVAVVAITPTQLLSVAPLLRDHPSAGLRDLLPSAAAHNAERLYDAALRLGQFEAGERVLDLLWELSERLRPLGMLHDGCFRMPLTQAHLADALGFSPAHLNRTLSSLRRRGLVDFRAGEVKLPRGGRPPAAPATQGQDKSRPRKPR